MNTTLSVPLSHAGVSTAEKRAQIQAAGEEWPTCDCHREPMRWKKDHRKRRGGWFECAVIHGQRHAARERERYATDPEYRARKLEHDRLTRLQIYVGGLRLHYRADPDKKQEIRERLAAFREHQTRTRKEMADNGWIY